MAEQHDWEDVGGRTHRCKRCGILYQPQPECAPLTKEEIKGALARAHCVCGHLLQEHGPVWCRALACECRTFRARESAS